VTAALSSRHKAVVARAVLLWNLTFGAQDALEYSPNLASALRRLRVVADLQLPTFPEVDGDEVLTLPCIIINTTNADRPLLKRLSSQTALKKTCCHKCWTPRGGLGLRKVHNETYACPLRLSLG
jgi:hypothetical protein